MGTALFTAGRAGAEDLYVNSAAWTSQYDAVNGSTLTLLEALRLASGFDFPDAERPPAPNGTHCIDVDEMQQMNYCTYTNASGCYYTSSGCLGAVSADYIGGFSLTIQVGSLVDLGSGDTLNGNSSILDGTGGSPTGLRLRGEYNSIYELSIRNFSSHGILCDGCKNLELNSTFLHSNGEGIRAQPRPAASRNPDGLHIGSASSFYFNLIYGNSGDGIHIEADPAYDYPAVFDILIDRNIIGEDQAANDAGNGGDGIELLNVRGAEISANASDYYRNHINFNDGYGVRIHGASASSNKVVNNFIGLDPTGLVARGNNAGGIALSDGATTSLIKANRIAGNGGPGVDIWGETSDGNQIFGNRIGTTADGSLARPNTGGGIRIYGGADNTLIGSDAVEDRNLISGNSTHGVGVYNVGTTGTIVRNNHIGTNVDGTAAVANTADGVRIQEGAFLTTVERNLISGNGNDGVGIRNEESDGQTISTNRIGTNALATGKIPNAASGVAILDGPDSSLVQSNTIGGNSWGVFVSGSSTTLNTIDQNTVGGASLGNASGGVRLLGGATNNNVEDNVIGWNVGPGVQIDGTGTTLNDVYRNKIGTNAAGTAAAPNANGVVVSNGASSNVIGGASAALGNLISGNTGYGVRVSDATSTSNQILSNQIGTTAAGSAALGNGAEGILLSNGSASTLVDGNVVSGNGTYGVRVQDANTSGSLFANRIGVAAASDATAVANGSHGVYVTGTTAAIVLGNGFDDQNLIARNGGAGIRLDGGNTSFFENRIFDNGAMAVDLAAAGPTANDLLDADSGVNGLLNMPVIVWAKSDFSDLEARVKYHGAPNTQHRLYLYKNGVCDPSRHGEALFLSFPITNFTTDGSGNALVTIADSQTFAGEVLSALVTRNSLPTVHSEMSTCRTVVEVTSSLLFDDSFESGFVDGWSAWGL